MAQEYDTLIQRLTQKDRVKEIILNYLERISEYYMIVFRSIQRIKFYNVIDPDFVQNLLDYISMVMSLYHFLRPKIDVVKNTKKLEYIDYAEKYFSFLINSKKTFSLQETIKLFEIFNNIENDLRIVCEERGYTADRGQ